MSTDQICLSKNDIDRPWEIAWAFTSYITPYARNGRAVVIAILLASFMEGMITTSIHIVVRLVHKSYVYIGISLSLFSFSLATIM